MTHFTTYTAENAPEASKAALEDVKKNFGFIPNLSGNMAESPELLAAYGALWDLFAKTTFSATEQQLVYLTVSFENECRYCMAGHTTLSKMFKIDEAVINAVRAGQAIPDAKLEALHSFTTKIVRNRGWVSDQDTDAFLAAGYTRRNALEVVLGVATKTISNYTNHIAHTQNDGFMAGNEWKKPVAKA
ncbi:carboxymuconolactone decarboxylase family protein [Paraburkholderia sp. BCC1885]|uniref:carboxymuconolactone decarboxylase family protein n=1 Tax=Paraburkholderia sp. BCC1885 TaxID=2562669 RepID=UPI00118421EF|nr:carboxymuconolactone decarboxylase family protein [Paraburkholderia sp. BCC1885]